MDANYCMTLELAQRTGVWFRADGMDAAIARGKAILEKYAAKPDLFTYNDLSLRYALEGAGGEPIDPAYGFRLESRDGKPPEAVMEDPAPNYKCLLSRFSCIPVFFQADNDDDARDKVQELLPDYQAHLERFLGGTVIYGYALYDHTDGFGIPWQEPGKGLQDP